MQSIGIPSSYGYVEETPDLEITVIEFKCPLCKPEPEETFPEHYIFKDFPENYLEKQEPPESDIMFPPRIP